MSEQIDNELFKEKFDALLTALSKQYPTMIASGVNAHLTGWLRYWAAHNSFNASDADNKVCELEQYDLNDFVVEVPPESPRNKPLDIIELRETMNDRNEATRLRMLKLGNRVPFMDADEEAIWQAVEERRRYEKEESDRGYAIVKASRDLPKAALRPIDIAPPPTSEQLWLSKLPEDIKKDFAHWCTRNRLLPVSKNWSLYDEAMSQKSSDWEDKSDVAPNAKNNELTLQQDAIKNRDFLAAAGWSDEEISSIDDRQTAKECDEELARQALNSPHYDGSNTKYSRIKVRPAQGRFRSEVLRNWGGACAITGQKLAIEACHIIAHAEGGASTIENGVALAVDLHRLLDSGHLHLVDGKVLMSDEAKCEPRYAALHENELRTPCKPVMFR